MTMQATQVTFSTASMRVPFSDGRVIDVPLAAFPSLAAATPAQRAKVEIGRFGSHLAERCEDISIAGLLEGPGDRTIAAQK